MTSVTNGINTRSQGYDLVGVTGNYLELLQRMVTRFEFISDAMRLTLATLLLLAAYFVGRCYRIYASDCDIGFLLTFLIYWDCWLAAVRRLNIP